MPQDRAGAGFGGRRGPIAGRFSDMSDADAVVRPSDGGDTDISGEGADREGPILVPGRTCWRIERAHRFSLIVDAADYFAVAQKAMARAQETIMAVGWDFDLRIDLRPDLDEAEDPEHSRNRLGNFVQHIVQRNPRLHAYILKWDAAMLQTLASQIVPLTMLHWLTTPRIHFRLDSDHPVGASHHQKILTIDDSLAFCGGIDMTHDRWDTREHAPADPRRKRPDGSPYGPFHDVTTACDGPAARALGEIVRRRWKRAGGGRMRPPMSRPAPWPDGLPVTLREVDVGIARTEPCLDGRPEVREIEALYLEVIRRAKTSLYLESQYFASARIRDALIERLKEPEGPEFVVVNPLSAAGWLEEKVMDSARAHAVDTIRRNDPHQRFRIYYPVNRNGTAIYVHAKVVAMDDRLLRIGSSNLNNRSMGFDTECDIAVEATPGRENRQEVARAIIGFRNNLLAEHLGTDQRLVERALEREGGLIAAIESLRRDEGHTLKPLEVRRLGPNEKALLETHLLDPERPGQGEGRFQHLLKRRIARLRPASMVGLLGGIAVGLWFAGEVSANRHRRDRRR